MKLHFAASLLASVLTLCASCASTPRATQPVKPVSVRDFGAVGDGTTKDTAAFQKALNSSAGTIHVPAGKYLIGSIVLPADTTLDLDDGATLVGSPDKDDYPLMTVRWEGKWRDGHRALIYAEHVDHIAITGAGTIEGPPFELANLRHPRGPSLIEPVDCKHVTLDGFRANYRRMWTIHLTDCTDVTCSNLVIRSDPKPSNGDGIDVDSSEDVTIRHCDIDTGDDAIALKSGRGMEGFANPRPTANVDITDCKLGSSFAGLAVGTEMSGGIRDIRVRNCTFTRGANAIFIKSRIGRGGVMQDIDVRDSTAAGPRCFLMFDLVVRGTQDEQPVRGMPGVPEARDISVTNIHSTCDTLLNGTLTTPDRPIRNLTLRNVTAECKKGIALANAVDVTLDHVTITGPTDAKVRVHNVTGKGLDGATEIPATTRPAPLP